MELMIIRDEKTKDSRGIEMVCDKKAAAFYLSKRHDYINIICKNAMHRAWRGFGNSYYGDDKWEQALEHYKSSAMVCMIKTAKEMMKG